MNILARYQDVLRNMPSPGNGFHTAILGISNWGVMAGIPPDAIFQDIRQAVPSGTRRIPDKEIHDAIRKAISDHNGGTFIPRTTPAPIVKDGKAALQRIIDKATIRTEDELLETSPIRLPLGSLLKSDAL